MAKLIYGVGLNDGKYPTTINGKVLKEYDVWHKTLARCYSPTTQRKKPTYEGCSVSKNFQNYSYFLEWCLAQVGFGCEDFQLDKDLIIKGNKIYSETTCLFLPRQLNNLLISSKAARGVLPIGVYAEGHKFSAQCCTDRASRRIGSFNTPEEAFNAYKETKEAFIKRQAEKWKAHIDPRAFAALMAYTISITD